MELFAAGDESQMNVIKRWIDESDIYLLILGGRYGSIEPASNKSYIHLEYEYAAQRNMPLFAVVITEQYLEDKVKKHGSNMIEKEHPQEFKEFKEFRQSVLTKLVKFWSDPRDIKLAILETLGEFSRREDLVGWIAGSEAVDGGKLAEELARLTKENSELRQALSQSTPAPLVYTTALSYEQTYRLLNNTPVKEQYLSDAQISTLKSIAAAFGASTMNTFHLL